MDIKKPDLAVRKLIEAVTAFTRLMHKGNLFEEATSDPYNPHLMPAERPIVIEMIDQAMVDSLRRKTPEQRLALSLDMWRCARDRLMHFLTTQHPDWDEKQIRAEFRRRMLGSD